MSIRDEFANYLPTNSKFHVSDMDKFMYETELGTTLSFFMYKIESLENEIIRLKRGETKFK